MEKPKLVCPMCKCEKFEVGYLPMNGGGVLFFVSDQQGNQFNNLFKKRRRVLAAVCEQCRYMLLYVP